MTYKNYDEWMAEKGHYGTRKDLLLDTTGTAGLEWTKTSWDLGAESVRTYAEDTKYEYAIKGFLVGTGLTSLLFVVAHFLGT